MHISAPSSETTVLQEATPDTPNSSALMSSSLLCSLADSQDGVPHAQELTDLSALISSSRCSLAGRVGCPSSLLNWILTASWRPLRGAACWASALRGLEGPWRTWGWPQRDSEAACGGHCLSVSLQPEQQGLHASSQCRQQQVAGHTGQRDRADGMHSTALLLAARYKLNSAKPGLRTDCAMSST